MAVVNRIVQPVVQPASNQTVPAGQGQGAKRPAQEGADSGQASKKAKVSQSGEMQSIARATFDQATGPAPFKTTDRKSLGERQRAASVEKRKEAKLQRNLKRGLGAPSHNALQASSAASLGSETDPDDEERQRAGADALENLRRYGRVGLQESMTRKGYDALQKYVVVSNAEQQLGKMEGLSATEKKSLSVRLADERTALITRERGPILAALNGQPERVVPTVMGENGRRPATKSEIRAMLGGTKPGGADIPLEPLAAGRVLRERAGDRCYRVTLQSLRANLMSFLRTYVPTSNTPALILAGKDSAALTQLETVYDNAHNLRVQAADRAGVLPVMSTAAMSFVFLGIAQSGKGKALDMAGQIYNLKDVDIDARARVADLLYKAVGKIPDQLWGYDSQRRADVLDVLKGNSQRIFNDMPSQPSLAERKENDIIRKLQEKRTVTTVGGDDKSHDTFSRPDVNTFNANPPVVSAY